MSISTAAIVGCNWGLTYLQPLRELGVSVQALLGTDLERTQAVAKQQQIPLGTNQIQQLPKVDLIIIAAPAKAHRKLIEAFPDTPVICEKPLQGLDDYPSPMATRTAPLWVNYAFSQLRSAKQAGLQLQQWQELERVELVSSANLALNFSTEQWFLETASHPLSWLLHLLGPAKVKQRHLAKQQLQLELDCNGVALSIRFEHGGEPGIFHQLSFHAPNQQLKFSGSYRPQQNWRFSPLMLNQQALNEGEYTDSDCWLDANARHLDLMLKAIDGQFSHQQALKLGLFDKDKALLMEHALLSPCQA